MNECNYNSSTENDNNKSIKRMQKSTWIAPHTWFCDYLCCFLLALGHYFQILGVSFEPASSKLSLKIQVAILLVTLFLPWFLLKVNSMVSHYGRCFLLMITLRGFAALCVMSCIQDVISPRYYPMGTPVGWSP
jgi:hypothetical protein